MSVAWLKVAIFAENEKTLAIRQYPRNTSQTAVSENQRITKSFIAIITVIFFFWFSVVDLYTKKEKKHYLTRINDNNKINKSSKYRLQVCVQHLTATYNMRHSMQILGSEILTTGPPKFHTLFVSS